MQFTMQFCALRRRGTFAYRRPVLENLYLIPILVDVHQLCAGLAAKLGDAPFVARRIATTAIAKSSIGSTGPRTVARNEGLWNSRTGLLAS